MKFMEQVAQKLIEMEYAEGTRRVYLRWVELFIRFHRMRHPDQMGIAEVEAFLTWLAVRRQMSASSGNQALDALRFLYRFALDKPDVAKEANRLRATTRKALPETVSRREIEAVISKLDQRCQLMAYLCYGSGLAIGECVRLRLDDIDIDQMVINVKSRMTMIPEKALSLLHEQMALAANWPGNVGKYVFPSSKIYSGRCWHVSESSLQKAMKAATEECGLSRRVTPKILRYSFIRHLLQARYDVRTVQEVAGYAHVKSVLAHQRVNDVQGVISPLDKGK